MTHAQELRVVLVADDEETVRKFTCDVLESYGYRVIEADGGRSAIAALEKHGDTIDVVILDLVMPDLSGEKALPELIRMHPELKVVMSSAYRDFEHVRRSAGHLISSFLRKPYKPDQLAEHVRFALLDRGDRKHKGVHSVKSMAAAEGSVRR